MTLPDLTDQLLDVDYVECNPVASDGAINSSLEEDEVEEDDVEEDNVEEDEAEEGDIEEDDVEEVTSIPINADKSWLRWFFGLN